MHRYFGQSICRIMRDTTEPHDHMEIHFDKKECDARTDSTHRRSGNGDTIAFAVSDHQAEVVQNMFLRGYNECIQPKQTLIEVYSAHMTNDSYQNTSSAEWEFMQSISPLSPQCLGSRTYVSNISFQKDI